MSDARRDQGSATQWVDDYTADVQAVQTVIRRLLRRLELLSTSRSMKQCITELQGVQQSVSRAITFLALANDRKQVGSADDTRNLRKPHTTMGPREP